MSASVLDASLLGDLPAVYTVYGLESHQMPAVGVYVDNRIITGFKYRVRPLPRYDLHTVLSPYVFDGKALTLRSIGRGYARRFTFEADSNCLNNNENYFWSDSRPEGFAFELELVSQGDKFTVFDANHEAQGTLEIMEIEVSPPKVDSIVLVIALRAKFVPLLDLNRKLAATWQSSLFPSIISSGSMS